MIYKNKRFNMAMLVSASCHVFLIFTISPFFVSSGVKENTTEVSFLGAILDKVIAIPEKQFDFGNISFMEKIENRKKNNLKPSSVVKLQGVGNKKKILNQKEKFAFSIEKYKGLKLKRVYKKRNSSLGFKNIDLSGDIKNRMILYKPEMPKLFVYSSVFASDYKVSIKIKISKDGFIENPECVVSSGSLDVDREAIRYIRKWQFVPSFKENEYIQEGIISVNFASL